MSAVVWAIVVAGGEGRRYGSAKQFADLRGRTVVDWAVEAVRSVSERVVLVVPAGRDLEPVWKSQPDVVVCGGPSRSASVRAGLAAVGVEAEVIVVHDGARPLASAALCRAVVGAVVDGVDGAVPGIQLSDTVKRVRDGTVSETLDRTGLVRVQTPQAFRAEVLRAAHEAEPEATDDSALVEAAGGVVKVVLGDETNLKITSPGDLALAEWWLTAVGGAASAGAAAAEDG